ncbi:hypothetical protein [Parasphingorhabdus sp.]|uniref:hypothetical protein n=1 Tax=Parasphingorhabdus sp. TaxID=2709688 RepID=UPI003A9139E0
MKKLYFRRAINCATTRDGVRVETAIKHAEFKDLETGDEPPCDDLVRSVLGTMTLEDGSAPSEQLLRSLNLADGIRYAVRPFFSGEIPA